MITKVFRAVVFASFLVFGLILVAMAVTGCAAVEPVRVSTRALYFSERQKLQWLDDGPEMEIVAHNDSADIVRMVVVCAGAENNWEITVPPHSEKRVLGRVLNTYTMATPCSIAQKEVVQ